MILKVPDTVKNKLIQYATNEETIQALEIVVLINGDKDFVSRKVQAFGGIFEYLGYGFGIVTVDIKKLQSIATIEEIIYFELPKVLYTDFSLSNKASCIEEVWDSYKLSGKGVMVGFIDSGIDYLHPAFKDISGNTRIKFIYDINKNRVWNEAEINKAIKSPNPYEIVNERDEVGHGTHVSGIACAGGNIDKRYYGVAYESSIAMVKMTKEGKVNYAKSTQLMRGIKFLIDKSKEIKMPLSMNLSFSTNNGAHDGNSLLELYIQTINNLERISFAIAAGNEGAAAHHTGALLRDTQEISMNIEKDEKVVLLQIYKSFIDDITIEIKSPSGLSTGIIKLNMNYANGNLGKDQYHIYNTGSTPFNLNGEIAVSISNLDNFITSGQWTMTINSPNKAFGEFDIWMPVSEGLNPNTKFLSPNPYNTLGIPATVKNVISVGSYNFYTNTISPFSGRGNRMSDSIKPDLVAPGEGIESSIPGGDYDTLSGTSMAAPAVAGAAALLMEWGLVKGNDGLMYGERLKYFLLKGAKRDRTDVAYPNSQWGYGTLCVKRAMDIWFQEGNVRMNMDYYEKMNKLNRKDGCSDVYISDVYENYIVEYDGYIKTVLGNVDYACAFILDENYAVVSVKNGMKDKLTNDVKEIVYVERSTIYTLNAVSPIDSANITEFHTSPFLNLTGRGVVVGFVDTGIDYLNKEFIYEDNTTRVLSIWDQTVNRGPKPEGIDFGTEFLATQINEAIKAKERGEDPYKIVDSIDDNGHGTQMAGIIGGRGREGVIGAAPDCDFVVVKLRTEKESVLLKEGLSDLKAPIYDGTDVILGIKYLYSMAKKMNRPMVIHIPLGTNMGGHDGSSVLERYIDDISKTRGIAVVTGTGNQGDSSTHASGKITNTGEQRTVEIKVDDNQRDLNIEIWAHRPDKISIGLVSPSGELVDRIPSKLKEIEEVKLVFEGSSIFVNYYIPEEQTGDELICIRIKNIKGGIWQLRLYGDLIVDGRFDIWLLQRGLLKDGTRFLNTDPYTTLTIPSTSRQIISSAVYDQNNNTMVAFSGRGYTRDNRVKPDIAAGGISVTTTDKGGGKATVSGSSVSSAVLSGAVALLLQWGIVDGNDKTLYSTKIKTYLTRGASKRAGDIYPNPQWGYGILDLNGVFQNIRVLLREEYEKIQIIIPEELLKNIK